MNRLFVSVVAAIVGASLIVAGCGQAAPAPTPTKAPAAPTKAAEPTKAPAAPTKAAEPTKAPTVQPTAVPAKKVDFPQKGKAITLIVAWPAGGTADVGARLLAPFLEKDLGTPVQVVNKVGGGGQVGMTELALAKPDGYTLGYTTIPITITMYIDPERKAVFNRKSFDPVALTVSDQSLVVAKADSPFKSIKDVVDAAKANPEKVKVASAALTSSPHLTVLLLQQAAGVKFAPVHFDGTADNLTAILGGHVDLGIQMTAEVTSQYKAGALRVLGIADKVQSPFYPGVPTLESLGYKVYMSSDQGLSVPAGTPREIVEILAGSFKKATQDPDIKKKMTDTSKNLLYLDPAQYAARWEAMEKDIDPLLKTLRK